MHAVWNRTTNERLARLGLDFLTSYVGGRGASLGNPAGAVVAAAFADLLKSRRRQADRGEGRPVAGQLVRRLEAFAEPRAVGSPDVRRADVAAAGFSYILSAENAHEDKAKGNRSQQITDRGGKSNRH